MFRSCDAYFNISVIVCTLLTFLPALFGRVLSKLEYLYD